LFSLCAEFDSRIDLSFSRVATMVFLLSTNAKVHFATELVSGASTRGRFLPQLASQDHLVTWFLAYRGGSAPTDNRFILKGRNGHANGG